MFDLKPQVNSVSFTNSHFPIGLTFFSTSYIILRIGWLVCSFSFDSSKAIWIKDNRFFQELTELEILLDEELLEDELLDELLDDELLDDELLDDELLDDELLESVDL